MKISPLTVWDGQEFVNRPLEFLPVPNQGFQMSP